MTKKEYQNLYYIIFGNTHLRKEFWIYYREVLMNYQPEHIKYFVEIKGKEFMKQHEEVTLGNCEAATSACPPHWYDMLAPQQPAPFGYGQEKGNNPMRIDTTTATAYVTAPKSDDATSREYLLDRLSAYESWRSPKLSELSELFNLKEDGLPKTYLQLIDAIKNDKFSLDKKIVSRLKRIQEDLEETGEEGILGDYGYGPFYGLVFTDLPKPDQEGYYVAVKELEALVKATKDTIRVKSPTEGLTALQALEAWTPAGKAS